MIKVRGLLPVVFLFYLSCCFNQAAAECFLTPNLGGDELQAIPMEQDDDGGECGDEHLSCEERALNRYKDCLKNAGEDPSAKLGCELVLNQDRKWYCPCELGTIPKKTCDDKCLGLGTRCILNADFMFARCMENAETAADRSHCAAVRFGAYKDCDKAVGECLKPKLVPVPKVVEELA